MAFTSIIFTIPIVIQKLLMIIMLYCKLGDLSYNVSYTICLVKYLKFAKPMSCK